MLIAFGFGATPSSLVSFASSAFSISTSDASAIFPSPSPVFSVKFCFVGIQQLACIIAILQSRNASDVKSKTLDAFPKSFLKRHDLYIIYSKKQKEINEKTKTNV